MGATPPAPRKGKRGLRLGAHAHIPARVVRICALVASLTRRARAFGLTSSEFAEIYLDSTAVECRGGYAGPAVVDHRIGHRVRDAEVEAVLAPVACRLVLESD